MTKQLPDGTEWPRYDDGDLVQYHDQIMYEGRPETVQAIYFYKPGHVVLSLVGVDHEKLHHLFDGATVKRPPVLDKENQEIKLGDTVWDENGEKWEVISFDFRDEFCVNGVQDFISFRVRKNMKPKQLTHTPPDSWEKLRKDAEKSDYWDCIGEFYCRECPSKIDGKEPHKYYHCEGDCDVAAQLDILARAEKLAGVMGDE